MENWPEVTDFVEPEKDKNKSNKKKGIIPNINPDNGGGGGGDMPNGGGSGGNLPKKQKA